jgi:porphobilinogen synthase
MSSFPTVRLRRLRQNETLRSLVRETRVTMDDLIYPIFVDEGIDAPQPVASMPGIHRIPEKALGAEIKAIAADGVKAVMLFGVSHHKDATGSDTWKKDGLSFAYGEANQRGRAGTDNNR